MVQIALHLAVLIREQRIGTALIEILSHQVVDSIALGQAIATGLLDSEAAHIDSRHHRGLVALAHVHFFRGGVHSRVVRIGTAAIHVDELGTLHICSLGQRISLGIVVDERREFGEPELDGSGLAAELLEHIDISGAHGVEIGELVNLGHLTVILLLHACNLIIDMGHGSIHLGSLGQHSGRGICIHGCHTGVGSSTCHSQHTGNCHHGQQFLLGAVLTYARGHEVDIELTRTGTGNGCTHNRAQTDSVLLQFSFVNLGTHGQNIHRVEILHRNVQSSLQELQSKRETSTATADIGLGGRIALVLGAVVVDGTLHLRAEAGHGRADSGSEGSLLLAHTIGIAVAEGDHAILNLELFGLAEAEVELTSNAVGDESAGSGDRTSKEATVLCKDDVGCLGTDIQQHHGFILVIVGTECVVERRDGAIHAAGLERAGLDLGVQVIQHVFLDSHQQHLALAFLAVGQFLVGIDDILQRKRNVLLSLKAHLLCDIIHINSRQLNEAHEHLLAGNHVAHFTAAHLEFLHHLCDGAANVIHTHALLYRVQQDIPAGIARERKTAPGRGKDAHCDALRANLKGYRCLVVSHM